MKKKYLHLLQIDYFFKTYPIVLFVQHHNLTVKDWSHLRMQLTQNHNIHILLFKNNIIKKFFLSSLSPIQCLKSEQLEFLFQGPCFACGCHTLSELKKICKLLLNNQNTLLIGGIYSNQLVNHLDVKKLLTLDNTIHSLFLTTFSQTNDLDTILGHSFNLTLFQQVQCNFLYCLDQFAFKLRKSEDL